MKRKTNLTVIVLESAQLIGIVMLIFGFLSGLGTEEGFTIFGIHRDRFMIIGFTITIVSSITSIVYKTTLYKKITKDETETDQFDPDWYCRSNINLGQNGFFQANVYEKWQYKKRIHIRTNSYLLNLGLLKEQLLNQLLVSFLSYLFLSESNSTYCIELRGTEPNVC